MTPTTNITTMTQIQPGMTMGSAASSIVGCGEGKQGWGVGNPEPEVLRQGSGRVPEILRQRQRRSKECGQGDKSCAIYRAAVFMKVNIR